jgi:pimeloyl-ACP methyl ester carboxylesterase
MPFGLKHQEMFIRFTHHLLKLSNKMLLPTLNYARIIIFRQRFTMAKIIRFKLKKRYIALAVLGSYVLFCQSCMTMRTSKRETKTFFTEANVPYVDSTVTIDGNPIHFIKTGGENRPTLFFVHGSPGSWDAYKDYLKDSLLLQKYRMIAIDRPGFGHSDFGRAENLQTQSDWITAFIEKERNGKPLVLIGHSLGGPVVVKLATMHPDWYAHVVVLSGAVDPDAEKPEKWRSYLMTRPIRWLIPGALRPSNDELWFLKSDLTKLKPELKQITSPVTIIHGTKDNLVPYRNVDFMVREFTSAKSIDVLTIENANHFIPWEHYAEIRKVLLDLKI